MTSCCEFSDSHCLGEGAPHSYLFEEWACLQAPCRTHFWTPDMASPALDVPNRKCSPVQA